MRCLMNRCLFGVSCREAYHLRTRPYEVCLIMMDYVPILSVVPFEIDRVELEMLDNGVLVAFKIPSFDIFQ